MVLHLLIDLRLPRQGVMLLLCRLLVTFEIIFQMKSDPLIIMDERLIEERLNRSDKIGRYQGHSFI